MIYIVVDAQGVITNRIILNSPENFSVPAGHSLFEETYPMGIGASYKDGFYTPLPVPPTQPNPVPTISKAQALLYLLMIGKTEADVDAEIAKLEPSARAVAQIEWKHRQPFHYDHPLFIELGPLLGITDMVAAFRIAATL